MCEGVCLAGTVRHNHGVPLGKRWRLLDESTRNLWRKKTTSRLQQMAFMYYYYYSSLCNVYHRTAAIHYTFTFLSASLSRVSHPSISIRSYLFKFTHYIQYNSNLYFRSTRIRKVFVPEYSPNKYSTLCVCV